MTTGAESAYARAGMVSTATAVNATAAMVAYAGAHAVAGHRWLQAPGDARIMLAEAVAADPLASAAGRELDLPQRAAITYWLGQHWPEIAASAQDLLTVRAVAGAVETAADLHADAHRRAAEEVALAEPECRVADAAVCGAVAEVRWRWASCSHGAETPVALYRATLMDPLVGSAAEHLGVSRCAYLAWWIGDWWGAVSERAEMLLALEQNTIGAAE